MNYDNTPPATEHKSNRENRTLRKKDQVWGLLFQRSIQKEKVRKENLGTLKQGGGGEGGEKGKRERTNIPPLRDVDWLNDPRDFIDEGDGTSDVVQNLDVTDLFPWHRHVFQQLHHSMRHVFQRPKQHNNRMKEHPAQFNI